MKQKLQCILLVDDDPATNFLHKMIMKRAGCAEKIVCVENGLRALEYLQTPEHGNHPQPDLILLDINMPGMTGWEFLDRYKDLEAACRGVKVILMLTTQLDPADMEKARNIAEIDGFMHKPMTVEMLNELLRKHFEEYL
ncbi:MAG TPA: response regulator [Eudoraea sp.]|nr:response regulator [Eudoraea sp.]